MDNDDVKNRSSVEISSLIKTLWNIKEYWVEVIVTTVVIVIAFQKFMIKRRKQRMEERPIVPCATLLVLGSGGHTTELLKVAESLDPKMYSPRVYVYAETDAFSMDKAKELEEKRNAMEGSFIFVPVKRVREVGQSWISTLFRIPISLIQALSCLNKHRPYLILCNGPGVCVPFCVIASVAWNLGVWDGKSVFIESLCRTKTLSLSGRILYYIVDKFLVQWLSLAEAYDAPHVYFMGRIC